MLQWWSWSHRTSAIGSQTIALDSWGPIEGQLIWVGEYLLTVWMEEGMEAWHPRSVRTQRNLYFDCGMCHLNKHYKWCSLPCALKVKQDLDLRKKNIWQVSPRKERIQGRESRSRGWKVGNPGRHMIMSHPARNKDIPKRSSVPLLLGVRLLKT